MKAIHLGEYSIYIYPDKKEKKVSFEIFKEDQYRSVLKLDGSWTYLGGIYTEIYFTEDRYYGYELAELSELYKEHVVPELESIMRELTGLEDIYQIRGSF